MRASVSCARSFLEYPRSPIACVLAGMNFLLLDCDSHGHDAVQVFNAIDSVDARAGGSA